ncbi:alpha/beta fold hydrolase [Roseomonas sp. BN140053]|uniref:alpha/beta fold hydrolase n=1 Tax=Roseomonas sp. BN140053 TaxID=3391898 RepID=UPI0039EA288D
MPGTTRCRIKAARFAQDAGRLAAALPVALALLLGAAGAQETGPLTIERFGSFHVGGRNVEISGQPIREYMPTTGGALNRIDPNGAYIVGAMYAQYMIPAAQRGTAPLMLWHGAYLTGATWETTPDGREGWDHFFLRRGWATYVTDAVERGRSGWAMVPEIFREPVFLPLQNPWERFRIGDGPGSFARNTTAPGTQFPTDRASYMNFMRQVVPRFLSTDEDVTAGYIALLERVGPSVVVAHSQGAAFAWQVAQRRPELFRALVLVEPAGTGDMAQAARLKDIPQVFVYGDNMDSRWTAIRENARGFAAAIRTAGGQVDEIDLPARGIRGNSHMVMMDRNGDQVAQLLQDWLAAHGFWR